MRDCQQRGMCREAWGLLCVDMLQHSWTTFVIYWQGRRTDFYFPFLERSMCPHPKKKRGNVICARWNAMQCLLSTLRAHCGACKQDAWLKSGAWDNHGNKDKPLHSAWLRTVPFDWLTIKCAWHLGLSRHVWGHLEVISQTITEVAFTIHDSFRLFSLFHVLLWYNKPILTLSFFLKVKSYLAV